MTVNFLICYSSTDASLEDQLESTLKPWQQDGSIKWQKCEIGEGTLWKEIVNERLTTSQVILLLISPDFMVTDYPYSAEMGQLLERHEQGKALVIPIILRAVYWQRASFAKLQVLPTHGDYVTSPAWKNLDEALFDVADGIRDAIEKFGVKISAISQMLVQNTTVPARPNATKMLLLNNLAVKYLCPSCLEEFYLGDCDIISTITGEDLKIAPTSGWLEKQRARFYPEPLTGSKYVRALARRRCVNCGYILPENIGNAVSLHIAVIGDNASGKSTYIASLLRQMKLELVSTSNVSFRLICLTPDVENGLDHLFHDRRELPRTQPAQNGNKTPLIYELAVRESPKGQVRITNLIFYEGAGEDYISSQRIVQFARQVFYADAIIFLVDPTTIPEISHQLPSHLQPTILEGRRPAHLLASILRMREMFYDSNSVNQLPIAITVSKSDVLKYLHASAFPATFLSQPIYSDLLDLNEIEKINQEVKAIIQEAGQFDLLGSASSLKQVNFFAVSATGWPPDQSGRYPMIEPNRCLDPLLWILFKLGVLPRSLKQR